MWLFEQGMMSQSVVIVLPAASGATSLLFKGPYQYGGRGNVMDTNDTTPSNWPEQFSGSVLTEIQLRSLFQFYAHSEGWWIALPGTPMPGDTVIPQLNLTAWPAAIRPKIRERLVQMGGVPLEYPLVLKIDSEGKLFARQVKKPDPSSIATLAELATDGDDLPSKVTLSLVPTDLKPNDTSKPCQHDWHTPGGGQPTYCWNCGVEK